VKYLQRCDALLQWGRIATNDFADTSVYGGMVARSIHRREGGRDLYFVANVARVNGAARCSFGVTGRQPELWNPVTGEMRDLPEFEIKGGRTVLPLKFASSESAFIVFRKPLSGFKPAAGSENFPELKSAGEITGPWQVRFDPKWGGPEKPVTFATLEDWPKRPEPGIRYFSGTAAYAKTFDLPKSATGDRPSAIYLDLGSVQALAEVSLNGKNPGAWTFLQR